MKETCDVVVANLHDYILLDTFLLEECQAKESREIKLQTEYFSLFVIRAVQDDGVIGSSLAW